MIAMGVPEATCDGLDNDCDGSVDNGLSAPPNSKQAGVCSGSTQTCMGAGGWQDDYTGVANYEVPEATCDGLDNDCDGSMYTYMDCKWRKLKLLW